MRILVMGAGALGGYFGARLAAAGRDVTFLVRQKRVEQLRTGLHVKSPTGDITITEPRLVTAENLNGTYDIILLSCKAFDLESAIASFAPAVGPKTVIIPVLNGMAHIDTLTALFGKQQVMGGLCQISATLDEKGQILHLNTMHNLTFGELAGGETDRSRAIATVLSDAGFDLKTSDIILQAMWEKWVFIASCAGITCLMRAAIGDILAAGAGDLSLALLDECCAIAAKNGFAPRPAPLANYRTMFEAAGSTLMASMLRDLERGSKTEVDHVLGNLMQRGGSTEKSSLLRIAYAHLKASEARHSREG